MPSIQTILHPTDFSDSARYAFKLACSLAKIHGARLIVAHVVDVEYGKHTFGGVMVEVRPPDYPERMRQALEGLEPDDPSLTIEHVVKEGRPGEEILRLAEETRCDLIVMGTHGVTGVKRLLLGSVAEQVLVAAHCPVSIAKIRDEDVTPADEPPGKESESP